MSTLQFTTDAAEFLAAAGDHLAADPVISTVVTVNAHRPRTWPSGGPPRHFWWLVVRDAAGAVVGAGMRSAPEPPHPLFLLPMPDDAAVAVARALHERGEETLAVHGALPAARRCAGELARLTGGRAEVRIHTRLHELGDLVAPPPVPGRLAAVTGEDIDLVERWVEAFLGDADEQAGRPRGTGVHVMPDRAELLRRIGEGQYWFWLDGTGTPVSLTGATPPVYGVARVAPVYTPPELRGHGWASNAVAEVSRRLRAAGARVCLFTDQANPTSNKIYAALGYRPVVDMANYVILR
ncbi:GNAT family N-acetyltransferase [Dactylosporangium aurantiacum]|uniref:GNAT family N-acetyltransferase n=1 Tax=Dactylosporangium aurantiacum TaxID=35754 RepID=A0A9Q9IR07_9ACTN|nr:GNAT family N-acetyltransferase [Dactylosporangium aurantiacum]MDG6109845.1 GNAT family N-acetyltransferase [Dactylosporangium aurantiacum]UWZ57829.1 GNAT family N-acetyltransferase [Dactylosporangium aurantiacum]